MTIGGTSMSISGIRRSRRGAVVLERAVMVRIATIALLVLLCPTLGAAELQVGVARTDVTPGAPIRLSGYAARKSESEGVEQRIYTRAVAIGTSKADASILMTLDSMAIPRELVEGVAARLKMKVGLARE